METVLLSHYFQVVLLVLTRVFCGGFASPQPHVGQVEWVAGWVDLGVHGGGVVVHY